jgi:uncharacterized protein (TIGR03435 family)
MDTFENIDLASLITMAYNVPRYRLSAPDWLATTRFEISARIPPGATREQYRLMLQGLLADRFKLTLHHENKVTPIYELQVEKNGAKLKESAVDPNDVGLQPPSPMFNLPKNYSGAVLVGPLRFTMARLANALASQLGNPVIDATGLTGTYDIRVHYFLTGDTTAPSDTVDQPSVFEALQEQLGLKLVKKNAPWTCQAF